VRIREACLIVVLLTAVAACKSTAVSIPDGASPADVKALADAAMQEGRYAKAARTYELISDDYPRTPEADQAEWLAAEAWYFAGELKLAQDYYQAFYDSHPLSNLGELGERMYDIGVQRFERGKGGIVGLGILSTSENGLKALSWITAKLPNGTRADDAYFFIGKARMSGYQFDEAVLNFDQILTRYPQSEWTHEARFLRALSYLEINRGPPYDRDSLLRSRRDFSEYVRIVERSEALRTEYADRVTEAKAHIAETNERLARKNVLIANFYESQERFEAERLYLENAKKRYPDTKSGQEAAARLGAHAPEEE